MFIGIGAGEERGIGEHCFKFYLKTVAELNEHR
jgi:hypothetical protein